MGAMDITQPNVVVGAAYAYGGLVQLCAGMWYVAPGSMLRFSPLQGLAFCISANNVRSIAEGNTFSATALSSYGAFWISLAITFTPSGFNIMSTVEEADNGSKSMFYDSLGLFLFVRPSPRLPFSPPNSAINKTQ